MNYKNDNLMIDGIDKIILGELISDSRKSINKIALKIGISGAAVHQRIKKLEKSGLISGSQIIINSNILGYTTMAFIGIYLDKPMKNFDAVNRLKKIPEVIECHYTTGNWSILVKILSKNNEHLMSLLNNNIQKIPGVSRTETFISLEQQISRQIPI
ncbi:MAG: transcriptional regulator [Flavobacteriaceae bacterium]|nr:transcriptional regulator [Flavobacteriaceae bacterium]|tara:strand:+ start:3910 stop:4380 length:471 start_codon:yes stop_codon:yes gene_type:complete